MTYLLEYVTEQTVLLRHSCIADMVRRFFADAGSNGVRAFYNDSTCMGGYVFYVHGQTASPDNDESGRYYKLVTSSWVNVAVQVGSGETRLVSPRPIDLARIERQYRPVC
jgi:hypothetical protein